ncbi:hypothetical protein LTS12_028582, partial [Elasticomyces elasticus]
MLQGLRRGWGKKKHRGSQPQSTDSKQSSTHSKSPASVGNSDKQHKPDEQKGDTEPQDLWQIAYESLSNEDQQDLSADQLSSQSTQTIDNRKDAKTLEKLEEVIQLTEQQYEDYQKGGLKITRGSGKDDINIRDIMHKILDAALSFKNVISAIAAFDPTSHAASAWAIVSVGLS